MDDESSQAACDSNLEDPNNKTENNEVEYDCDTIDLLEDAEYSGIELEEEEEEHNEGDEDEQVDAEGDATATNEEDNSTNKAAEEEETTELIKEPKLKEVDVGIKAYVSDHEGFFGIIKQRFSDFLVNEISEDGEVIQLTDQTVISPPLETPVQEEGIPVPKVITPELQLDLKALSNQAMKGKRGASANGSLIITEKDKKDLSEKNNGNIEKTSEEETQGESSESKTEVTENDSDALSKSVNTDNGSDSIKNSTVSKPLDKVVIDVTGLDKTERALVHQYIKSTYENVSANTKIQGDIKCIVVSPGFDKRTVRTYWPKDKSFTTFTLYKENIDTMEAVNVITWRLKLKTDKLGYAGTKDRRGKTSQQVCAFQINPMNLSKAIKGYESRIHIGNFKFLKDKIVLGKLSGNRFQTVIREVKGDDDVINDAISSLKENGFVNYYGMQRFGTTSIPTYAIGSLLLKGNWQEAVDTILKHRDSDTSELSRAREIWCNKRDAAAAFSALGKRKHTIEGKLLQGLRKVGANDYLGALYKIPNKTRMLYLHSYQSYIWNCVVSRRIEKYGLKVLPGDIIKQKQENSNSNDSKDLFETDYIEEFTCQVYLGKDGDENESCNVETNESSNGEETVTSKYNVHVLTEEEAEKEEISNILLPLPGFNITYPDNEIKDWYVELLENDNLNLEMLKAKQKAFSLCGTYRHIIVKPSDVSGKICYYDDPMKPLVASDLDLLNNIDTTENCLSEGKHKAVLLDFKLPSSTYATMALREILKMDTSPQYQSSLNYSYLSIKNQPPWQKKRNSPKKDGKNRTSPRWSPYSRGGNRGFNPKGRRGWNDWGRGGRGWGSPRGRGNERGRWPGGGRGRAVWTSEMGRGGPIRGRGGRPPLNAPGHPGNVPPWRRPEFGDWNMPPQGPPMNRWPESSGPHFDPPGWHSPGSEWNRGRGGPPMRGWGRGLGGNNWNGRGRGRGGSGRGNKRPMSSDGGFKTINKRGRF